MYLEKLEIQGFKSFAKKTVLEFPNKIQGAHSVTGIVGPNGSGKSNVADAIRWVLGEQSIKTLRGKKSQDVIFSGSDKKARLGFAEVSLYLNNEDKKTNIDYTELVITRRVYQSGEGEYFINRSKARLSDIQMLLAKANFGQRTYSIIGQGMADSVLSASLQERKELFDEAVGVRQFQIKREQALNKFKATRENLAQTELTLQEIDPRLKSLTRQVKKLEKREEISRELKTIQTDHYAQTWQNLDAKIKLINIDKKQTDKIYQDLTKQLTEIQDKINQFSLESSRQAQYDKIQNEYTQLISQKNNLLHQKTILQAKIDADLTQQGQANLVWLKQRQAELEQKIRNIKQQITALENELEPEKDNLKTKQEKINSINQRLQNVREELSKLQKTTQVPFEQEKEIELIFSEQQALVNQLLKINELSQLEEIKTKARQISQKLSLYLEKLKNVKKQETADLVNLQNQLEQLSQDKNGLSLEINQITLTTSLKQEKINTLKNEITNLENEEQKNSKELELNQYKPKNKKDLNQKINLEIEKIDQETKELETKIKAQEEKISHFNLEEQSKKEKLFELQKDFQTKQTQSNQYSMQINQFNIELAKYQTKKEDLETEIGHDNLDLNKIKEHKLNKELDENEAYQKIEQLKRQLEIIGGIDEETQTEYEEIKKRYDFLSEQSADLEEAIKSLEKVIEELDKTIKEQFDKAFKGINREFQQYFKILFNGGHSELVKVSVSEVKKEAKEESEDQEEEEEEGVLEKADKFAKRIKEKEKEAYSGIEIKAIPPGKKIKSVSMLSGGERALTSIALICAIISNNPSPFIVLDEVDAPLDEANAERFNTILQELSKKTQFVVVTHNRVTMHFAHVLYGVTMGDDGISKLLSIKLADAEDMVGQT